MDLSTLIGIVAGFILIFYSMAIGGGAGIFFNVPSIMITGGGMVASTLITFPLKDVIGVFSVVKKAFLHKEENPGTLIRLIVGFAETARREGILSLEQKAEAVNDEFLKNGIRLAVDGTEPELIRDIMRTELDYLMERHKTGQAILEALGFYGPAFGMIGTLIGLVQMLRTLEDPSTIGVGMATALITTFYGALAANLIFLPMAGKLKNRTSGEVLLKELSIEGILSIQSGDNPRIVENKLMSFISPRMRATAKE